ncbi:hypothetical protein R1sor_022943 [Riccia sorocarpa]|uniref:Endonuclease/exonuclease/phosphatase domain-containing protein n=1 Tax=Riccia sorocarpa TaxID=122646 RepID=A0ABD3GPA4_9MARC
MDSLVVTAPPPLRAMQWNILADGLAQFGDFHWSTAAGSLHPIDNEILDWSNRGPKVLDEIVKSGADLVCLQEVNHFSDFLLPRLAEHGYDGIFKPKRFSPASNYGFPPDGCALFYRSSRLQLKPNGDLQLPNQAAIICVFKDLAAGRDLIVATTHFKAKTGRANEEMRMSQARSLLQTLGELAKENPNFTPIVVCGDFNAVPTSEVYDYFLRHELGLKSVYSCRKATAGGEGDDPVGRNVEVDWTSAGGPGSDAKWTSWKYRSTGMKLETNDYIWVSKDQSLRPTLIRDLPSQESLGVKGLPLYPGQGMRPSLFKARTVEL